MKTLLLLVIIVAGLSPMNAAVVELMPPCGSLSFKAAPSLRVGSGCCGNDLESVALDDLNNDGRQDIVTVNGFSGTISVVLGGGESFSPVVKSYPVGGHRPYSVAVGDFNGDGKADVVTANLHSENLSILTGDGTGGFTPATHASAGSDPVFVATADFNGDAKLDLAVVSTDTASVNILAGNGTGGFAPFTSFATGNGPRSLTIADFNLDGKTDLAVANRGSNNISVLAGNGAGGFTALAPLSAGTMPERIATGDFNADGKPDLVVANYGSFNVSLLIGVGDGRFGPPTNFSVGSPVNSVTVGDFNNDGNADIAAGSNSAGISVRLGNGAGNFGAAKIVRVGIGPHFVGVTDFNLDGTDDLIVATLQANAIMPLPGDGTGNFTSALSYTTNTNVISTVLADFNNDGKLDTALANENTNTVSVRLGAGTGAFGNAVNYAVGTRPYWVSTGDFNNDGKVDLVTANFLGGVSVLLGDGAGNFGAASALSLGFGYPSFVAVNDINNDGKADLLVIRFGSQGVALLLGNGAGGFSSPININTPHAPHTLVVSDFNGDGKPDLALADNHVSILLGDGAGNFGAPLNIHFGTNTGAGDIVAGDFNADGKQDLALANEFTNDVSVLIGEGTGKFAPLVNFNVGLRPSSLKPGDFDGDGKLDLAVANFGSDSVGILLGDGAGGFGAMINWAVPVSPNSIAVGDLNSDGRPDITAVGNNTLAVLLNTCAAAASLPDARLTVDDATITETDSGTVNAVFNVRLASPSAQTVTTKFFTSALNAVRDRDFQPVSGTLAFPPGVTIQTVSVPVMGDTTDEFDEAFVLNLYDPVNALIADRRGFGTITDNDLEPSLSIGNISTLEGQVNHSFGLIVTLSQASGKLVTVGYTTASGTATAGADYGSSPGTLIILPGETANVIGIPIVGDSIIEPDETFFVDLVNPVNASVSVARGMGTIVDDDFSTLQFAAANFDVAEDAGRAAVTVSRTGDISGQASVRYLTLDNQAAVRCDDRTTAPKVAFARCDYSTTVDTLYFAAGEAQKTFNVSIIDDAHVEGAEKVQLQLAGPVGATLGAQHTATLTITNDDAPGEPNPIFDNAFFVRQHYLDFLSREPEQGGMDAWMRVLNRCSDVNNNPECDRITVSSAFFRSTEFQLKGYFIYRFYKVSFGTLPLYNEIITDMRSITGETAAEVFAKRTLFADNWVERPSFKSIYDGLDPARFVDTLMNRYGLGQIRTPDPANPDATTKVTLTRNEMVDRLLARTLTRAQVVRAIADSDEVFSQEYNRAFVAMQYYGYLRRTPEEEGYNSWLRVINEDPENVRVMVNGFMNSVEYRLRFGRP
ncbi:MAG TPA: FG-GAP-like repeat-containing protein [Pyrinomonadaceae bacterium]